MTREKAIKILSPYKNSYFGDASYGGVISVSEIIELLSAQPEIIHCGECKHMLPNGRCLAFADLSIRPMASDYCSHAEVKNVENN